MSQNGDITLLIHFYEWVGDDNDVDDDEGGIYADDQQWLQQQDVAGRIVG
jgi:hypothetical protein